MYPDRDFDLERALPWNVRDLSQDLELNQLFEAMAGGDKFLFEIAKKGLFASETDLDTIRYRQGIMKDFLEHPDILEVLYSISVEAEEGKRNYYWISTGRYPSSILMSAVGLLEFCVTILKKLRQATDASAHAFRSEGLQKFCAMLREELSEDYFAEVEAHLKELKFRRGALVGAELGEGNKGRNYVLLAPKKPEGNWLERLFASRPPEFTYHLHPRDEAGARALSQLRDRGLNLVANAAAQSADHVLSFLKLLRAELGFYVASHNLRRALAERGKSICLPSAQTENERSHTFVGLYDVSLVLAIGDRVVGNDLGANDSEAILITGANRGGKSVFLRSIGIAQLMMQCGMFVGADAFSANVCTGLCTHYKREEDASMRSGKFDEEVARMSDIAEHVKPDALILFNESFAATNDREGSEIARQIVEALLEKHIKVVYVTHLYEFARKLYDDGTHGATFLRAERQADGSRTFKLVEAPPLETSYGEDLYNAIFLDAEKQSV